MGSRSEESGSMLSSWWSDSEGSSVMRMDLTVVSESSSSDVPSVVVASESSELSMSDKELDNSSDADD